MVTTATTALCGQFAVVNRCRYNSGEHDTVFLTSLTRKAGLGGEKEGGGGKGDRLLYEERIPGTAYIIMTKVKY